MLMVSRPVLPGELTLTVASPGRVATPEQLATVHWVAVPSHVVRVVRLYSTSGPKSLPTPLKSLDCLAATFQVKLAGAHGLLDGTRALTLAMSGAPGAMARLRSLMRVPEISCG